MKDKKRQTMARRQVEAKAAADKRRTAAQADLWAARIDVLHAIGKALKP